MTGATTSGEQKAAWNVGERKDTVYEIGIRNLTDRETSMLVHFGKERAWQ